MGGARQSRSVCNRPIALKAFKRRSRRRQRRRRARTPGTTISWRAWTRKGPVLRVVVRAVVVAIAVAAAL
eukprot:5664650-Alexandrium_andersonii.AAC.1